MNTFYKLFALIIVISALFSSCSSVYQYYQIGEIKGDDDKIKIDKDGKLVYFDENVFVEYSFWGNYGNVRFIVKNISDKDIILHLDKSYFVRNGIAYDYFQNRTYTKSGSIWDVNLVSSSESNLIIYKEVPQIIIPVNTSKIINQFNVTDFMYRSCDLYLWESLLSECQAKHKSFRSKSGDIWNKLIFNTKNTPLSFENRLVYSFDSENKIEILNKFYVESIRNVSENEFEYYIWDEKCGENESVLFNEQYAPNRYYINYNKDSFDSKY